MSVWCYVKTEDFMHQDIRRMWAFHNLQTRVCRNFVLFQSWWNLVRFKGRRVHKHHFSSADLGFAMATPKDFVLLFCYFHFGNNLEACLGSLPIWKTNFHQIFDFLAGVLRLFHIKTFSSLKMSSILWSASLQKDAATPAAPVVAASWHAAPGACRNRLASFHVFLQM